MARIRTVKPELFRHEDLFEAEIDTGLPLRLAFIGLFCCCDREGRFAWKPRQLKLDVLPWDNTDFSRVLDALATRGFVRRYKVDGVDYGCIPSFTRHQVINNRETASNLPEPPAFTGIHTANIDSGEELSTPDSRVSHASVTRHDNCKGERKGKEREKEGNKNTCAEVKNTSAPAVITLPLIDSDTEHVVTEADVAEYQSLYLAVDVMQELRNMRGWLIGNPKNRKTKAGIRKFISSWLGKAQNQAPRAAGQPAARHAEPDWGVPMFDATDEHGGYPPAAGKQVEYLDGELA